MCVLTKSSPTGCKWSKQVRKDVPSLLRGVKAESRELTSNQQRLWAHRLKAIRTRIHMEHDKDGKHSVKQNEVCHPSTTCFSLYMLYVLPDKIPQSGVGKISEDKKFLSVLSWLDHQGESHYILAASGQASGRVLFSSRYHNISFLKIQQYN